MYFGGHTLWRMTGHSQWASVGLFAFLASIIVAANVSPEMHGFLRLVGPLLGLATAAYTVWVSNQMATPSISADRERARPASS